MTQDVLNEHQPVPLDPDLRRMLGEAASAQGLATLSLPSGAGHDAGVFADVGIPTGMIFIRSHNGSHNPLETMELDDFREATRLLAALVGEDAIDRG